MLPGQATLDALRRGLVSGSKGGKGDQGGVQVGFGYVFGFGIQASATGRITLE